MEEKVRNIFERVYESHPQVDLRELRQFEERLFFYIDAMKESNDLLEQMAKNPNDLQLSNKYVDMVQMTRN